MKHNNFNKLGGTELRTKKQINIYMQILNFIKKFSEVEKKTKKINWEKKFIKYCQDEEIYNYRKTTTSNANKKIKRTKMIINSYIVKKTKIFLYDKQNDWYYFNNDYKNLWRDPLNLFFISLQKNYLPFNKLVEFLYKNKDYEIDFNQLSLAFFTYENDNIESFEKLYKKKNLLTLIINLIISKLDNNKMQKFRKPPKNKKWLEIIYYKKINNETILTSDYDIFKSNGSNIINSFLKNHYGIKKSEIMKQIIILNELTKKQFIFLFYEQKLKNLLCKEYMDLFSRWLFDFGLLNSSGKAKKKITFKYDIILKKNIYILIRKEKNNISYPYTLKQVKKSLLEISQGIFIKKNRLLNVANSAIAEYFVNLYFAMKFKLTEKEFLEFSNTCISLDLFPISTAPGGMADMEIVKDSKIINIETTIHKSFNQIANNEIRPCIKHINNRQIKNEYLSATLFFLSYCKKDNKNNLENEFKVQWSEIFKNKNKLKININNFNELV